MSEAARAKEWMEARQLVRVEDFADLLVAFAADATAAKETEIARWKRAYEEALAALDQRDGPPVYSIVLQRAEAAEQQAANWQEDAEQRQRNIDYYRRLLQQIAATIGPSVYVSDDGSIQDDPILAKVPDLVKQREAGLRAVVGKIEALAVEIGTPREISDIERQYIHPREIAARLRALLADPDAQRVTK